MTQGVSSSAFFGKALRLPEFMEDTAVPARGFLYPLAWFRSALLTITARLGAVGRLLARDHFIFFALVSFVLALASPRHLVLVRHLVETRVLGHSGSMPDLAALPYVPNLFVAVLVLFVATFHVAWRVRIAVFVLAGLALGIIEGYVEPRSLVAYTCFLGVVFLIIRAPMRRWWTALVLAGISVGFAYFCHRHRAVVGSTLADIALFQASFTPMLWYSAYEHLPPRRRIGPLTFLLFHFSRFFYAPVFTYKDLEPAAKDALARTRFNGLKALFIALVAACVTWAVEWVDAAIEEQTLLGASLLGYSYLVYVGAYCKIVVLFNVFTGALRLFGIPIRDSFNYWILARTPNEHWQRWNILLREWIVTYVFFPIMRAKRWLFIAIMAALLTSGVLHLIPVLLTGRGSEYEVASTLVYWTLNGLAIYVVVMIPRRFPGLLRAVRMEGGLGWSVVGVLATSAFYGLLYVGCHRCESWFELGDFLARLVTLS